MINGYKFEFATLYLPWQLFNLPLFPTPKTYPIPPTPYPLPPTPTPPHFYSPVPHPSFPFTRAVPIYCVPNMYTQQSFRFQNDPYNKNPSFSSTLLDKIYRSIDEGERTTNHMNFYNDTLPKKKHVQEPPTIRRPCLLRNSREQMERKSRWHHHHQYHDQELMFFTSTSSSSDSSSGLLSSSDTESLYGVRSKSRVSCFAPSRPKTVMMSASHEEGLIKSKSRALKIYNNLKKVKQPMSPGGKLSNFLNSLFAATGNVKRSKTYEEPKAKSGQESTCSSTSRSCLSKASTSSKDKLRDGVKRTVRFYPISVIVDEDCRPCGHKCLYQEDTRVMSVSVPTAWKIGREEQLVKVVDKSRRVEEPAREFLKEYHRSHKKSDSVMSDFPNVDVQDDDDAASYSSSDLFELDHLSVIGNNRYLEELPVYETTHLSTNRAIANGLI
ncbi:hypothetical protein VNO78_00740 [Psophocarpus tetragonolobus]|uniref:Protein BIG GRAIN 1-like B n=1 Tax=Psophocarpus tetragonolobus TaxID=3891 RepID=A0AAN9SYS7_PSOTE